MNHDINIVYDSAQRFLAKSYYSSAEIRRNDFRIHHHAECELCTILSGSGIYRVKDKCYDFKAGSIFLFSGDEEHCITDIYSPCEILNIHFSPRILWSEEMGLSRIFFARSDKYESMIDKSNPITKKIFDTVLEIERECAEKHSGYRSMIKYKLLWIITQLVREYPYVDDSVSYSGYKNHAKGMDRALRYIDENLTKELTLSDIAGRSAMDPSYFSTVFKKLNGISLWDYITAKRVELAIELLKTSDMTKLDIAMQCGFNSSSNFYKAFSKVTGRKPSDYTK